MIAPVLVGVAMSHTALNVVVVCVPFGEGISE